MDLPHQGEVPWADWNADGERLATLSDWQKVQIWRTDGTGKPAVLHGHESLLTSVAWSPDGQRLVTTSIDDTARIWRADAAVTPGGHPIRTTSPEGHLVLTLPPLAAIYLKWEPNS